MSKTPDSGKDEVARLCQYFATNQQEFFASGMKEAHVRQVLIDPFLEALGWDVRNTAMAAPQYREVIPEDSLDVEGHQKAPDYTFRVGTLPKFYVEAKKCGVNLHADPAPAYQLRRYGWSAKVAVSLLTDFEELGVYDCTSRPRASDKASRSRIQYFRFEEYADRWRELWDVFSREAVWSGAFDQYAASKRSKRGTSEVDIEFLQEIERWRDALARNIAIRNKDLSSDDLNAAVQRTIDRVVFLRMAEDRGLEPYEQLLKACDQPHIYARFMRDLCRKADEKYNSGLFHFRKEAGVSETPDNITPNLTVDDKVLKPILQGLYFAHGSPYHFGVLPVEILGTVYERFLGKVIRLTAGHQAKIEDKPEVRKAGGVYYTPAYIVDYIVKATVGRHIGSRSPAQLAGGRDEQPFRVLDMACGSGSFLLGAYQFMLDHCLKWYIDHKPASHKKAVYQDPKSGEWRLTNEERKRILTTHLFGVDLDPQAIEVSKLSLLLKALEGENDTTLSMQMKLFHARALPNLSANIKCGNSLIGADFLAGTLLPEPSDIARVHPFDWEQAFPEAMRAGGFDCIIGNPPYIKEYVNHDPFHDLRGTRLAKYYQGKMDIWQIFACLALDLLKPHGLHGFIATNNWITNSGASILRQKVLAEAQLHEFVDFGDYRVFDAAGIQTMIYVMEKSGAPHRGKVLYRRVLRPKIAVNEVVAFLFGGKTDDVATSFMATIAPSATTRSFTFADDRDNALLQHIADSGPYRLRPEDVAQGIVCPQETVIRNHLESIRGEGVAVGDGIFILNGAERQALALTELEASLLKPYYTTSELSRYYAAANNRLWVVYTDARAASHMTEYPHLKAHLDRFAKVITSSNWPYGLHRARDERFFLGDKIASLRKAGRPCFTFTDIPCYVSQTFNVLKPSDINLKYLTGLLNSQVCRFWLRRKGKMQGDAMQIDKAPLLEIPIVTVNRASAIDCARHDRMVSLVDRMMALHKRLKSAESDREREALQVEINATDSSIDRLTYELYGLSGEEIEIMECER